MNKTAIDWCDYSVNPVKGLCPVDCKDSRGKSYCYARGIYRRFKRDETIRYEASVWNELQRIKKPARIFVGSTMELFGPWAMASKGESAVDAILDEITTSYPQHTFIFLTKRPQELKKYEWPDNCWVGASATDADVFKRACNELHHIQAKVRFVSVEPLLSWNWHNDKTDDPLSPPGTVMDYMDDTLEWLILGQVTPVRKNIPQEWVTDIVEAADKAGIPVFMKDNLKPIFNGNLRQEWPNA